MGKSLEELERERYEQARDRIKAATLELADAIDAFTDIAHLKRVRPDYTPSMQREAKFIRLQNNRQTAGAMTLSEAMQALRTYRPLPGDKG